MSSPLRATPSENEPSVQADQVDREKQAEYDATSKKPPIEAFKEYVDGLFAQLTHKLEAHHTPPPALKHSLNRLKSDLVEKSSGGGTPPATDSAEMARKKAVVAKLKRYVQSLGDDVLVDVQKTVQKLDELSEQVERKASRKPTPQRR